MKNTGLLKLARLSGARSLPPLYLYDGEWPRFGRQLLQVFYSFAQWLLGAGRVLYLSGPEMRAGRGHLALTNKTSLRGIMRGGCVLRGGTLQRLASELGLLPSAPVTAYLADANVLVVLGEAASGPVVVHVADEQMRVGRYLDGCEHGRAALKPYGHEHLVPTILRTHEHSVGYMLTQRRIDGYYLASTSSLSAEKLVAHVHAAFEPLMCLEIPRQDGDQLADAALHQELMAALSASNSLFALTAPVLEALNRLTLRKKRVAVLAHGDYWMANLLFTEHPTVQLRGILDWERIRLGATVGADAMHLLMFSYAQWKGCSEAKVLCMILDDIEEPTLCRLLDMLKELFNLDQVDIYGLAAQAWVMFVARYVSLMPTWTEAKRDDWLVSGARSAIRWADGQGLPPDGVRASAYAQPPSATEVASSAAQA